MNSAQSNAAPSSSNCILLALIKYDCQFGVTNSVVIQLTY